MRRPFATPRRPPARRLRPRRRTPGRCSSTAARTQAWRGYNRDSFPAGDWVVEDGALKTVPGAKEGCDLVTRKRYRNFELTLEWKVGPGGNSGILYRAAELPAPTPVWHSAPELQILDDAAHSAARPRH